ncbi:hypothetical protein GCM10027093_73920 [Paraburkholderia jirisanensis]
MIAGFWHSHIAWMVRDNMTSTVKYVPDLLRDPLVTFVNRNYLLWVASGILLPGLVTGLIGGSLYAGLEGLMWGGFVRIFLVHHAFWIIGSLAHLAGDREFRTGDESRNNFLSALVNMGEGWHNNHHAFSNSARFGLHWYQIDMGYWIISVLKYIGAAEDVRMPSIADMQAKRIVRQEQPS